jgi:hypothetical protein
MRSLIIMAVGLSMAGCVASNAADMRAARLAAMKKATPPVVYNKPPVYEPTIYERRAAFQLEDYIPYQAKGTSTLSGEAFVVMPSGEVRFGAGVTIRLIPATAYGKEFLDLDLIREEEYTTPPLDERIYSAIRSTQADSKGQFSFSGIPSGNYFLYTAIYWDVPARGRGFYASRTGGRIWKSVAVANGEQATITLTRQL